MNFADAVMREATPAANRGYTRTENGMRSLKSTLSASVDLFGGLTRGKNLVPAFEAAFQENPDVAMRLAQYARDVRGGQGERKIFRDFMLHLERTRPDILVDSNILKNVAEVGRFDDLLIFNTHEVKAKAYAIVAKALSEGNGLAVAEAQHQIEESKEHAEQFAAILAKAEKRFNALKKVEQRHAEAYHTVWETL